MKRLLNTAALALFAGACLYFFNGCKTTSNSAKGTESKEAAPSLDLYQKRGSLREFIKNQEGSTFTYRDGRIESIVLGDWNGAYSFHSLKIGDDYSLIEKKLKPDFELAYKLQSITNGFIYLEKKGRQYYVEIDLDEQNRVYLIRYQYDHVYTLD